MAVIALAAVFFTNGAGSAAEGLLGFYYRNPDLTGLTAIHVGESIDFAWNGAAPDAAIIGTNFSVRWSGTICAPTTDFYSFILTGDDGIRLWINNQLIIDKWVDQGTTEWTGAVSMSAGVPVPIRVEYYQHFGGSVCRLAWSSSTMSRQTVPASVLKVTPDGVPPSGIGSLAATQVTDRGVSLLWSPATDDIAMGLYTIYRDGIAIGMTGDTSFNDPNLSPQASYTYAIQPADAFGNLGPFSSPIQVTTASLPINDVTPTQLGTGLQGAYFQDLTLTHLVATHRGENVGFDWAGGQPDPLVAGTNFSVRWSGMITPQSGGNFTFFLRGDDGIRLWIDNLPLIDAWRDQSPSEYQGTLSLTANRSYSVRIEYYQRGGGSVCQFSWSGPGVSKQIVPTSVLSLPVDQGSVGIATIGSANPAVVVGTTTALTVLGSSTDGEAGLVYSWAAVSAPPDQVFFSANGSNAAKSTLATFRKAGRYVLEVSIMDGNGHRAVSDVAVSVIQTPTSVLVSPVTTTLAVGAQRLFQAIATDQFANPLLIPPQFIWTSTGGMVTPDGQFRAGPALGSAFEVRASALGLHGTASLTIVNNPPTVDRPLKANAQPVVGASAVLSILGSDDGGESNLVYSWSTPGQQSGTVTFSDQGTHAASTTTATFSAPGTYTILATITDGGGLSVCSPLSFTVIGGTGLLGTYYPSRQLDGTPIVRIDQMVNFDWQGGSPDPRIPPDQFSARWTGTIRPRLTDIYTITTTTDDGVRVWLDGILIIDNWTDHGPTDNSATVRLNAGSVYHIRMEYYENTGGAVAELAWSAPSIPRQTIPTDVLFPAAISGGTGLTATYYDQADLTGNATIQVDDAINFNWGNGAPLPALPSDLFSVRWNGRIQAASSETYTITLINDDGVRVWMNGQLAIDDWNDHAFPVEHNATFAFTAGMKYDLVVEYYDRTGPAGICMLWSSPTVARQSVPQSALYPVPSIGTGTGLLGSYFNSMELTGDNLQRVDATIDFHWNRSHPVGLIGPDNYSVMWTGFIQPQFSEVYTFATSSDDGVRLAVDGKMIIDDWQAQAVATSQGSIFLTAGRLYRITLQYYQQGGDSEVHLLWKSDTIPLAVIPQSQLYPATGSVGTLAITTPLSSRTSPLWLEGTSADQINPVVVTVDGIRASTTIEDGGAWYATTSPGQLALGLTLSPDSPRHIQVDNGDSQNSLFEEAVWEVTDVSNMPYGQDPYILRRGDSLLLTASGTGATLTITISGPGAIHDILNGPAGNPMPYQFSAAGPYQLVTTIDGRSVATTNIKAVGADLLGPIACEIGYQRIKNVASQPASALQDLIFTAGDPGSFLVSPGLNSGGVQQLFLTPLTVGTPRLQARLARDPHPIISSLGIDEFTFSTTGAKLVQVIQTNPDGSLLTRGRMTMTPLVRDLEVQMHAFIAGVTFDDSTTNKSVYTNDFTLEGTAGYLDYYLIRAPSQLSHLCHTLTIFQSGFQVSHVR
ncbi:MAG: hypothetical protein H0U76_00900 [Ktedonobacteraceae bacterium]|nr:hypothetical protein [Ktedonobacteraceae bacterium]